MSRFRRLSCLSLLMVATALMAGCNSTTGTSSRDVRSDYNPNDVSSWPSVRYRPSSDDGSR